MKPSCLAARRRWLYARDVSPGPVGKLLLASHFAACPACRDFTAGAERVTASLSGAGFPAPDESVARVLSAEASRRLEETRERTFAVRSRRGLFHSALGSLAGAAAALLLVMVNPAVRQDPIERIQARAEQIEAKIGLPDPEYGIGSLRSTLENDVDGLEEKLRCLEAQMDELDTDSLEGGDPCEQT